MKIVIYTSIVGSYEGLLQPVVYDDTFDYICFSSDIEDRQVGVWKIVSIPCQNENQVIRSRYVKLLPHQVLDEYDYSVWMDANIQITGEEFYESINQRIDEGAIIAQVPHPTSSDIYQEIRNAYYGEKVKWQDAWAQIDYLRKMKCPEGLGMFENNVMLRKHNDPTVISISEDWWSEFYKSAPRDQFSLMYVYWKHNFMPSFLFDSDHNSRNVPFLKYHVHPSMQKRNDYYKKHRVLRALNALKKKIVVSLLLR